MGCFSLDGHGSSLGWLGADTHGLENWNSSDGFGNRIISMVGLDARNRRLGRCIDVPNGDYNRIYPTQNKTNMRNKKNLMAILVVLSYAVLYVASSGPKVTAPPPAPTIKAPSYDFEPPQKAPAKSAQVVFLLVDPAYQEKFAYSNYKIFSDFSKAMAADYNESLTAKGYSVRGPFEYYDQVVYNDKKESDLLLQVEIDFDINSSNVNWNSYSEYVSGKGRYATYRTAYKYAGFFILSGKVNLVAAEPLTKEKLWAKSIPLKQKQVYIAPVYNTLERSFNIGFSRDPGVINPMIEALEDYYKQVFNTSWNHLDPNELAPLKKEVLEIREKKKY